MEFVPIVVMLALIKKLVDVVRYATGRDWNAVVTQVLVWFAGVVVVTVFAASDWAGSIALGDLQLENMNLASLVLAGLTVGSAASVGQDVIKAVDNGQTEAKPPLLRR